METAFIYRVTVHPTIVLTLLGIESFNRELLVVNEVQHHQKFVDTSKKKTAACQQYEMMCKAY